MGHLKPAIRRKQKNVFSPVCHICHTELDVAVTSNAQAGRAVNAHIREKHGSITSQLKSLEY
jgi:hypothetical protein